MKGEIKNNFAHSKNFSIFASNPRVPVFCIKLNL
jgi:hypothetical protein